MLTQMITQLSRKMSAAAKHMKDLLQKVQPKSAVDDSDLQALAQDVFALIDADRSGTISPEEASTAFGDDDEMWQFIVEEADTDGDGESFFFYSGRVCSYFILCVLLTIQF